MKQLLITIAFSTLEKLIILRIKNPRATRLLNFGLALFKKAAEILTDGDPDNEAQLKELWRKWRPEILEISFEEFTQVIEESGKDPIEKEVSLDLLNQLKTEIGKLIANQENPQINE